VKKLYSTDDRVMAGLVQSILEEEGIRCVIKNQSLAGAIGELPPIECWPEVWVIHDEEFVHAQELIDTLITPVDNPGPDWKCSCGETVEGQFLSCWNCGRSNPEIS